MNPKFFVFLVVFIGFTSLSFQFDLLIGFNTSIILGVQFYSLDIVSHFGGLSIGLNYAFNGSIINNYGYSKYDNLHNVYMMNNINPPFMTFIDNSGPTPKVKTIHFGNIKIAGHHAYPVKSFATVVAFDNYVNSMKEVNVYSVNYKRNDTRLIYAIGLTGNWTFQTKIPMFVDESANKLYLMAKNSFTNDSGIFVYDYSSGKFITSYVTGTLFKTFVIDSEGSNLYGAASNGHITKLQFSSNIATVLTSNWCSSAVEESDDNTCFDLLNHKAYSTIKCGGAQRLYTYNLYENTFTHQTATGFSSVMGLQSVV